MSGVAERARAIFLEAIEGHPSQHWPEFLVEACGGDEALRARVERLLEAHRELGSFRADPTAAAAVAGMPGAGSGAVLGPYTLLERLGEGGMGVVYLAEQDEPVRRRVALKVIRPGMDTDQVLARFEAERQALEVMDHPNVARVLDAGATDSGRPYFVMELVPGIPITRYCDEARLTPRQRLEVFIPVCKAIQHAHQKGIIHRDIKPSNVLITEVDGRPVPKVIDFGVAKATDARPAERTLLTRLGVVVGTPEYMSPEQAQPDNLDIDTRSDIYSLGVLLYELLTGTTPLDRKRLKQAAILELLRVVREEEPPRPSTRLSGTEELPSIAASRGLEPRRLTGLVRGELDWIVMRALEKDRSRRYETAAALAADVERYCSGEPVEAGPPSAWYRLRKSAQRHRAALTTAGFVAVALIAGTAVSLWQASVARRQATRASLARAQALSERNRAREAEAEAAKQRDAALKAKRNADEQAAIAGATSKFLLEDLLQSANMYKQDAAGATPDPDITVRTLLDRASEQVGVAFADQPAVEAAIRHTLGDTYRALGLYAKAKPHLERAVELRRRALGHGHPDTLASQSQLGGYYWYMGELAEAERLFRGAWDASRKTLGPENLHTLAYQNNLAGVYRAQRRLAEAEPLLRRALEGRRRAQGPEHPEVLDSQNALAQVYHAQGRLAEAESLLHDALEISRRVHGPDHPATLTTRNNLATVYLTRGERAPAERLLRENLAAARRVLGPDHPDTLVFQSNLARSYELQGKLADAEPLARDTLDVARRVLGPGHPNVVTFEARLARLRRKMEQDGEAAARRPSGLDSAMPRGPGAFAR
jgi:serine/threonine protein kinase